MASLDLLPALLLAAFCASASAWEADALPGWLGETHHGQSNHPASLREPRVKQLAWRPRAFLYSDFLSQEECDHIIKTSRPTLTRSTVVDSESGKSVVDEYRSSFGTFLDKNADAVVARVEERIARWTFLPVENQESMQVLRYGLGQKYEAHTDYFDEGDKENQQGGHRVATVLMYLSNVERGGETVFPESEPLKEPRDDTWSECGKRGAGVKPRKGDALLFWSLHPNATADPASLHAGCPVEKGEKWSATKWIHVRSFDAAPAGTAACVDEDPTCASWAEAGECQRNPGYMMSSCRKSCTKCSESSQ